MHSEILRPLIHDKDAGFPYSYLLQWEWPEHIELLLRRLIWTRLVEQSQDAPGTNNDSDPSDYLATKLCFLMAVNPDTSSAVLDVLASLDVSAFAERVAENPNTAPSTLARLAEHGDHRVRCAVAENGNTSADVVARLASDEHVDVRYTLAENHNLPSELLAILSEDANCYVAARAQRTLIRLSPPAPAQMPFRRSQDSGLTHKQATR